MTSATGEAHARGVTESESANVQELESHMEKLAEVGGLSKTQAMVLTGEARVGGGWNFIAKLGADGSAMWRGETIESDAWNRMQEYDRQHGVTETWSKVAEASPAPFHADRRERHGEPGREPVGQPYSHAALRGARIA